MKKLIFLIFFSSACSHSPIPIVPIGSDLSFSLFEKTEVNVFIGEEAVKNIEPEGLSNAIQEAISKVKKERVNAND